MPEPLLSATALAEIRKIGEGQMQTEVKILRGEPREQDILSPGYNPDYDYGDDDLAYEISESETYENPVATSRAWFYSSPQTQNTEDGQLVTVDLHEIRLPVGTDVRVGDIIERVDNGEQYAVVDTNGGDTWAEKLRVNARRLE